MQNTLNPGETFIINRILKDHTDSTTYYVRAVVYDAETRTVLATKDLTDNGERWFSGSYKVPHDNVFGNGKRIVIVTSVYTDAGYTTKSTNHGDEPEEYLIQQRWNPSVHFGGGNTGYDEKTLIKLLTEAMREQLKPIVELEPVEFPEVDTVALVAEIMQKTEECMARHVAGIQMPQPTDIAPVLERLTALAAVLVERPKFEKTDIAPVLKGIEETKDFLTSMYDDVVRVQEEVIMMLVKENKQLRSLTNGEGGSIRIEGRADEKKQTILTRLAMKNGVKPRMV